MTFTLVSFHAHPDDEALLTGGTLARAAAEGHRVVLVVATAGEAGLAADRNEGLGARRLCELRQAAGELGCARVEVLGYPDSGSAHPVPVGSFAAEPIAGPAARLAEILREERADALTIYDARGGYGHPDHIAVHHVGLAAAALAGTRTVLAATVDRTALRRAARLISLFPKVPPDFHPDRFAELYTAREQLTHRIDVRRYAPAKRRAMTAHVSQRSGGDSVRTLALLLRLPPPVFHRLLGAERFVEIGRPPGPALCDDLFDSVRRPHK
ncbi:MAG TPA: PIG-L family deacetylase [Sporichthyaceae bacterium]